MRRGYILCTIQLSTWILLCPAVMMMLHLVFPQQFGSLADCEIIYNERGSKVLKSWNMSWLVHAKCNWLVLWIWLGISNGKNNTCFNKVFSFFFLSWNSIPLTRFFWVWVQHTYLVQFVQRSFRYFFFLYVIHLKLNKSFWV